MLTKFVTASVMTLVISSSAFAADLPLYKSPPPVAAPFSWGGLYAGLQLGYQFGSVETTAFGTRTGIVAGSSNPVPKSVTAGGHVGYNYMLPAFTLFGGGSFVGVEGDVATTTGQKSYTLAGIASSYRNQIEGSIRGRAGFAFDRFLVFGTAGAAFGSLRNTYTSKGLIDYYAKEQTGYTLGAGLEYALGNRWSVRAEYRFTDFGTYSQLLATSTAGATTVRHHDYDNRFQAGVTYHFSLGGPEILAARY